MDRMAEAIPESIQTRKPIVVGSGHALSKDFFMSGHIPLWFMHAYGPNAVCVMTGPTDRQVKKVMWGELSRAYQNRAIQDEFGELQVCNLLISPDWYVTAFTTKETGGSVGKLHGFHARAVCIIVTESQAIPDVIFEEIESLETAEIVLTIFLGNPLRTSGRYAKMLRDSTNNIHINLSCLESPNVIERKEVIPGLCSHRFVDKMRDKYGEDSPIYIAKVLGKLPKTSINTVISEALYEKCQKIPSIFWREKHGSIGIDPARFGDDNMVISVWESGKILEEIALPYCDAPSACSQIAILQKKHFPDGGCVFVIDCDGLGGPYLDFLKKMIPDQLGCQYIEVHGCSTDSEVVSPDYQNLRAEIAFHARSEMEAGKIEQDRDDWAKEEAIEEQYFINNRGKIQIEDKEDIKDRLGRSPDRWDARKLAIWGFKFSHAIRKKDAWRPSSYVSAIGGGSKSAMTA